MTKESSKPTAPESAPSNPPVHKGPSKEELQGVVMLRLGLVEERLLQYKKSGEETTSQVITNSVRQSDSLFGAIVRAGIEALTAKDKPASQPAPGGGK